MKYITLFEDYSDEEIKTLMGDLADVGLGKKWRMTGKILTITPEPKYYKDWEDQIHDVFIVEVVADSEKGAQAEVFEKLKSGDFTQKLSEKVPATGNILEVIPEVREILSKANIIKAANGKANQQPAEKKNLSDETVYDGKIRWVLTVDLMDPTEEAILDKIKSMTGGVLSPEMEDFLNYNVTWNLSIEEI